MKNDHERGQGPETKITNPVLKKIIDSLQKDKVLPSKMISSTSNSLDVFIEAGQEFLNFKENSNLNLDLLEQQEAEIISSLETAFNLEKNLINKADKQKVAGLLTKIENVLTGFQGLRTESQNIFGKIYNKILEVAKESGIDVSSYSPYEIQMVPKRRSEDPIEPESNTSSENKTPFFDDITEPENLPDQTAPESLPLTPEQNDNNFLNHFRQLTNSRVAEFFYSNHLTPEKFADLNDNFAVDNILDLMSIVSTYSSASGLSLYDPEHQLSQEMVLSFKTFKNELAKTISKSINNIIKKDRSLSEAEISIAESLVTELKRGQTSDTMQETAELLNDYLITKKLPTPEPIISQPNVEPEASTPEAHETTYPPLVLDEIQEPEENVVESSDHPLITKIQQEASKLNNKKFTGKLTPISSEELSSDLYSTEDLKKIQTYCQEQIDSLGQVNKKDKKNNKLRGFYQNQIEIINSVLNPVEQPTETPEKPVAPPEIITKSINFSGIKKFFKSIFSKKPKTEIIEPKITIEDTSEPIIEGPETIIPPLNTPNEPIIAENEAEEPEVVKPKEEELARLNSETEKMFSEIEQLLSPEKLEQFKQLQFESTEYSQEKQKCDPIYQLLIQSGISEDEIKKFSLEYRTWTNVKPGKKPDSYVCAFVNFKNLHDLIVYRATLSDEDKKKFDSFSWGEEKLHKIATYAANFWSDKKSPDNFFSNNKNPEIYKKVNEICSQIKNESWPDEYATKVKNGEITDKSELIYDSSLNFWEERIIPTPSREGLQYIKDALQAILTEIQTTVQEKSKLPKIDPETALELRKKYFTAIQAGKLIEQINQLLPSAISEGEKFNSKNYKFKKEKVKKVKKIKEGLDLSDDTRLKGYGLSTEQLALLNEKKSENPDEYKVIINALDTMAETIAEQEAYLKTQQDLDNISQDKNASWLGKTARRGIYSLKQVFTEASYTKENITQMLKGSNESKKQIFQDAFNNIINTLTASQAIKVESGKVSGIDDYLKISLGVELTTEQAKLVYGMCVVASEKIKPLSEKNQKKLTQAENAYSYVRGELKKALLSIPADAPEDVKLKAELELEKILLQIDFALKVQQSLGANDQAFEKLKDTATSSAWLKGLKEFTKDRGLAFGIGLGSRSVATAPISWAALAIALPAGLVSGGFSGKRRAEKTQTKISKWEKQGVTDQRKNQEGESLANPTAKAELLTSKINSLINEIDNARTYSEQSALKEKLQLRLFFTKNKLAQDLINYGDPSVSLTNGLDLNRAMVEAEITLAGFNPSEEDKYRGQFNQSTKDQRQEVIVDENSSWLGVEKPIPAQLGVPEYYQIGDRIIIIKDEEIKTRDFSYYGDLKRRLTSFSDYVSEARDARQRSAIWQQTRMAAGFGAAFGALGMGTATVMKESLEHLHLTGSGTHNPISWLFQQKAKAEQFIIHHLPGTKNTGLENITTTVSTNLPKNLYDITAVRAYLKQGLGINDPESYNFNSAGNLVKNGDINHYYQLSPRGELIEGSHASDLLSSKFTADQKTLSEFRIDRVEGDVAYLKRQGFSGDYKLNKAGDLEHFENGVRVAYIKSGNNLSTDWTEVETEPKTKVVEPPAKTKGSEPFVEKTKLAGDEAATDKKATTEEVVIKEEKPTEVVTTEKYKENVKIAQEIQELKNNNSTGVDAENPEPSTEDATTINESIAQKEQALINNVHDNPDILAEDSGKSLHEAINNACENRLNANLSELNSAPETDIDPSTIEVQTNPNIENIHTNTQVLIETKAPTVSPEHFTTYKTWEFMRHGSSSTYAEAINEDYYSSNNNFNTNKFVDDVTSLDKRIVTTSVVENLGSDPKDPSILSFKNSNGTENCYVISKNNEGFQVEGVEQIQTNTGSTLNNINQEQANQFFQPKLQESFQYELKSTGLAQEQLKNFTAEIRGDKVVIINESLTAKVSTPEGNISFSGDDGHFVMTNTAGHQHLTFEADGGEVYVMPESKPGVTLDLEKDWQLQPDQGALKNFTGNRNVFYYEKTGAGAIELKQGGENAPQGTFKLQNIEVGGESKNYLVYHQEGNSYYLEPGKSTDNVLGQDSQFIKHQDLITGIKARRITPLGEQVIATNSKNIINQVIDLNKAKGSNYNNQEILDYINKALELTDANKLSLDKLSSETTIFLNELRSGKGFVSGGIFRKDPATFYAEKLSDIIIKALQGK